MTTKGGLQSRQDRQTLFAQRGQVATNARKGVSESLTAEATGDLLLHFDHAQISLSQIVVKIYPQILQEGEHGFLLFAQAIEQIARGTLCASPALASRSGGPRACRSRASGGVGLLQRAGFLFDGCPWLFSGLG